MTDNSFFPADTGANNESVLCRKEFHDFAVFRFQSLGGYPGCVIKHFNKARPLKGEDAELGKQLLLTNPQTECAARQVVGFSGRVRFNDRIVT
jgi:hypothetical protein